MDKGLLLAIGRGLLILAAVYVPTFAIVSAISTSRARTSGGPPQAPELAIPLVIGISLGIALFLMVTVGGRRFWAFGFRPAEARALWWSLGLGLGMGALLAGLAQVVKVQLAYAENLAAWQLILFSWIGAPIQEEVIFRGLFQGTVQEGFPGVIQFGRWELSVAALVTAMIFALVYFGLLSMGAAPKAASFIVTAAFILGLLAGQLRWSSGSLLPCFMIHALFNMAGTISGWITRS